MNEDIIRSQLNMTFIEWLQYVTFRENFNVYAIAA